MKQSVESFSRATAPRAKVRAATRPGHFGLGAYLCLLVLTVFLIFGHVVRASAHDIGDFVGRYSGSAELPMSDGTKDQRDLSIVISETDKGFKVQWNTVTEKEDGRRREKSYEVEFIPSDRGGIYAAAMQRNVFWT